MSRIDRVFSRVSLGHRTSLARFYLDHLWETKDTFENTPHVLWTAWHNEHGFATHKLGTRMLPLNGYLLYKDQGFALASDEMIVTTCGVRPCLQTAHMKIIPRAKKF